MWWNCFPPGSQYIGVSGLFTPNWRRSWMGAEDIYRGVITSRPLPILPPPIVDKHIFIYIIQFRKIDLKSALWLSARTIAFLFTYRSDLLRQTMSKNGRKLILLFSPIFCCFSCFYTPFLLFLDPKVSRNGKHGFCCFLPFLETFCHFSCS